jgi:hypothetical protein
VDNVAAVGLACGQVRRCVEDKQGGSDNPQKGLPIDAAVLNEGVPTGLHLEELIAQGLDPGSAVEELRKRRRC